MLLLAESFFPLVNPPPRVLGYDPCFFGLIGGVVHLYRRGGCPKVSGTFWHRIMGLPAGGHRGASFGYKLAEREDGPALTIEVNTLPCSRNWNPGHYLPFDQTQPFVLLPLPGT